MIIDKFSKKPIYEQILEDIERQILLGILKPMDKLPSVRALSAEITINPNTIQKAYGELERLGITSSTQGQGRFVAANAVSLIKDKRREIFVEINRLIDPLITAGMSLDDVFSGIRATRKENNYDKH